MSDTMPGTIEGQTTVELPAIDPVSIPAPADDKPKRTRRAATPRADAKPKTTRTTRTPKLETRLSTNIVTLGSFVALAHQGDGLAIVAGAPKLAEALAKAADENPRVRDGLERMMAAGVWSGVVTAVAAIAIPIAANHGLLPKGLTDSLTPDQGAPGAP